MTRKIMWIAMTCLMGCGSAPARVDGVHTPAEIRGDDTDQGGDAVVEPDPEGEDHDAAEQPSCCGCGQECNTKLYACLLDAGDRSQKCNMECMYTDGVLDQDACLEECSRGYAIDEENCEGAFQTCGEKCDAVCEKKPCLEHQDAAGTTVDPACTECLEGCGKDDEECMLIAVGKAKKCEDQCVDQTSEDGYYDCSSQCDPEYLEHEEACRQKSEACEDACGLDACAP